MAVDTNKPFGKALLWYLDRFTNRYNEDCDLCWAGFIAVTHLFAGVIIGLCL